jgi:hypothetical protein
MTTARPERVTGLGAVLLPASELMLWPYSPPRAPARCTPEPGDRSAGGGGVVTGSLQPLPEFGFSKALHFNEQDLATAGQTAIGRATSVNSGLAAEEVLIEVPHGDLASPDVVGSILVHLAPGSSYDASHPFPVNAGQNQYDIRLTAVGGSKAISLDDNVSSAALSGVPDIEAVALVPSNPAPQAGEAITLTAFIRNNSNQPLEKVRVAFFRGDPLSALLPAVA